MSVADLAVHSTLGSSTKPCPGTLQFPSWVAQPKPNIADCQVRNQGGSQGETEMHSLVLQGSGGEYGGRGQGYLLAPLSLVSAFHKLEGEQEKPTVWSSVA